MTSQINGLNQGNRNANDGIAFAQTAEGALDEISSMFQKVRTLAVQANNGTNTAEDKKAIATEMGSLLTEVKRIALQTTYGGAKILNGDAIGSIYSNATAAGAKPKEEAGKMSFQVGANAGDIIDMEVANYNFCNIMSRANKGDVFKDMFGAAAGTLIQITADKVTVDLNIAPAAGGGAGQNKGTASDMIKIMDAMIADVDSTRASLGAIQNRLESSIRNQSNTSANEADARSRIRDADFAEESANLSQQSIIQQAATSMLMQANTRPQLGLSLLG